MKRIIIIIMTLLCALDAKAQSDEVDSLLLDLFGNEKVIGRLLATPSFYLFTGVNYDNKTFYAGRELGDNMHVVTGNLYVFHSGGFYLGASGLWYSQIDPSYTSTTVTAGLRKPLNKRHTLTMRLSYSRYFFNIPDTVTLSANKNSTGAGVTWRNNWIGTRVSLNAMFGHKFGINISPALFSNLTLMRFGETNRICLAPEASAFIGSETIEYENAATITDPLAPTYSTKDKYGLLNTQINLPVCFYAGDFSFEIGYSINLPMTQDKSITYPLNSFFSFSIGFFLPLNK